MKWKPFLNTTIRCTGHYFIEAHDDVPGVFDINSLRPSDATYRHRTWSKLDQVMASCPTTQSHYLNQCWFIIKGFYDTNWIHFYKKTLNILSRKCVWQNTHVKLFSLFRGYWVKSVKFNYRVNKTMARQFNKPDANIKSLINIVFEFQLLIT